jgi:alpha-2-macroglobulin
MGQYRKWLLDHKGILIGGGGALFAVVLAVAVSLYLLGGKSSTGESNGGVFTRIAGGLDVVSSGFSLSPPAAEAEAEFAFHRVDIDTSKAEPVACLVFTRALDASGQTKYKDYLALDPAVPFALSVVDQRLCLAGLDFSKTYNVTLKAGLPSAAGDKLIESETIPFELRDKPSIVQFGGGIILPRRNLQGVPLTTVNVAKVKLKLIRVGDRLLSQIESGTVDETTLYSWSAHEIENNQGSLVWQGTMDVRNIKNDTVVTLIPIDSVLKNRKSGAYVLIASDAARKTNRDDPYDYSSGEMAVQWVVDSDMALTTFKSPNGLSVFVRSYSAAKPMSGVKLALVARNNNELATVKTDSSGRADFDAGLMRAKGGDEPVVVMAYGDDGEFSFIDLRRSAFDLSDRGVSGRDVPGPLDAYLYSERGVYRPGEIVWLTALLRDRIGNGATAPLTLVASRPDGMEAGRTTIPGGALQAGAASWKLPLSSSAPHGRWQIAAYVDTSKEALPIGRVQFDVQDFVPQKLKVTLTVETKSVKPGEEIRIKTESRFLYGAPASGLSGEAQARIAADPAPFDAYKGWQFGRMDDRFSDVDLPMKVPPTDAAGLATAAGTIGELSDTTLPLHALVRVAIHEPGGRSTAKTADVAIRNHPILIGIRPDFQGASVGEGQKANFQAVALNAAGQRIDLTGVTVSWVREDTSYQWYQDEGNWKYKSVTRDRLITASTVKLGAAAPLRLGQSMAWGTYRLTLTDPKSGASSSLRYYSGWAASSAGDRPDRIPVAADKPFYRAGETAHVRLKPGADGRALVVVAGDKVFSSRTIDAPAKGTTIDIPVSADWGAGAYVLVTDYRPLDDASGHEPVRSVGLVWLALDNAPRTLTPLIGGPQKILPRQKLNIPVVVKGLARGEQAWLTLSAVDEGILQLTDFKSPDPNGYYFGKRRLGVEMRDDYGRLIKAEKGAVGPMREGGDMFGGRSLAVVPVKTVSLYSGLVKIGGNGMVNVPVDVPDFNGELRLMAVAVSPGKLGRAARPLTVRDPVVADLVLPRFLAPGDRAQVALNLNNVEGRTGDYTAMLSASGPLAFAKGGKTVITQHLVSGKRVLVPVEVTGRGLGVANVSLRLTGPAGFMVTHSWGIEVRSPQLDIARDETLPLPAGASFTAGKGLVADLVPGTQTVALTVSAAHGYANVPGLLKWLDKYPFGCIEQQASRAMPLLVFNDLADLASLPRDRALRDRVQNAADAVLDMQNPSGNFGMWGPGSDADPFIGAYALDFLMQAKDKGYIVPNDGLRRGLSWLRRTAASHSYDDASRAYAFYLLARAGQVNISDLRYFSDTRGPEWNTVIAAALTGAASAEVGDRSRAAYGFKRALQIAQKAKPNAYPQSMYGSLLRDLAAATALAAESSMSDLLPAFLARSQGIDMRLNYTTTQEKAWMLRAAYELGKQRTRLAVLIDGQPAQPRDGAIRLAPSTDQLSKGLLIANKGDAGIWRTISVQGTPSAPLPAMLNGMTLAKSAWTLSGSPADLSSLHQNDRVLIEISGRLNNNYARQIGVIDLLPAGFEIEQTLQGDEAKPYNLNGTLTTLSLSDKRDDRYVAAFTLGSRYNGYGNRNQPEPQPGFRIVYVARAVAAGSFTMPAAAAQDMYAPGIGARTIMGTVSIRP